ncbi:hypothetical protein [Pseudomonas proteolytica]|uniref:hypothetical protein n=1 Tax=Pseudomonas proteolytica TaxID=219574 RepID=UPI0030ED9782
MMIRVGSRAFTLGTLVLFVIGVVASWGLEKALDHFFDLSLFTSFWKVIIAAYEWLLRDMYFPLWIIGLLILVAASAFFVAFYYYQVTQKAYVDLDRLEAKIAELENPIAAPITDDQQTVLKAIAEFIERQTFPNFKQIKDHLQLSHLKTEAATDALLHRGFIEWANRYGVHQARLTPAGRAYLINLDHQIQ